ncbi:tetratricopeptide repeat protein [Ancylostoma ceylanicum]|uniref:Tetratricopeptide repeat protein n=1 Tax=Ancylostoma ceylanicum TaxID=53326 RepID=A0A0D6LDW1_9BILA|nr:tetratricopeptide repeat protein [Ancylostoma ceylanicum]
MASLGLVALMCVSVQADLFTSMAEMQDLLDSEKAIPAVLYKYIEDEQERLVQLRELARQYQEKNDAAIKTGVEDISNPVNAFLLIRKKASQPPVVAETIFEWRAIESEMLANKADDFIERMSNANYRIRYPTEFRYCFREFCFPILLVVSSLSVHGLVYRFAMVMTRSKAARGGNSVYSGAVDDESSSMEEVNNSAKVSLFVKRAFAKFIEKFQSVVRERDDLRGENRLLRKKFGIPEDLDEDLTGAAIGLLRLQDTYRLNTTDLAQGRIYKDQGNYTFDAGDCFTIAKAAYNDGDYYHAIMWMEEALKRLEQENEPTADREEVLDHLSYSLYKQGNLKHALKLVEELYKLNPRHPRAKGNIEWYEDLLAQEGVKKADMRRSLGRVVNERPLSNEERSIYESLCRNEVPVSEKELSKLYCYYKRDRPFLVYAPIKVEIKRFNPLAVLFKDVISDEEVEQIQKLAKPKLARATVHEAATGKIVNATYRISKSAWLKGWEGEVVERVNKRIDMMTNLEMETAEDLQIANYGIGGHFDPHFDHAKKEDANPFESLGTGNRIATVLFYIENHQLLKITRIQ